MGRITRLSSELANQIAAGEVVERPAAVVKELVENAIDAGATRVAIRLEQGGKRTLRVDDDGHGMDPADARLSLERHATSKIGHVEDLAAIGTLGFRGEALPSIASVSHFTLRTRAREAASGTEIRVNGGTVEAEREVGMPEGTRVEVEDLFYNVPARQKFLKSDRAETTHASRWVTQLALAHPELGVSLASGSREMLSVPPARTFRERLHQLYGDRVSALVEVRREVGPLRVHGYVAGLAAGDVERGPQNVFVNGRVVKDRTIAHAVLQAYGEASIKQRSPEVHLCLEVPLDQVDVNVHPTKAEVRFREPRFLHEIVYRAVREALGRESVPGLDFAPDPTPTARPAEVREDSVTAVFGSGRDRGPAFDAGVRGGETGGAGGSRVVPGQAQVGERPLVPLGQFRDTFIIAVDDEGVAIVDQHVAHERILFEQIAERLGSGRLDGQRLLAPLVLELSAAGIEALAAHASALERLGFDVEAFGGGSVRVRALPALLDRDQGVAALRAIAEDLDDVDRGRLGHDVDDAVRRIAATMACHAAVKAHDPLTTQKMAYLLAELRKTAHSTVCPHGRPVMLRVSRQELEKRFERT